jgi:DNA-binding GntR family transcriptional regulator
MPTIGMASKRKNARHPQRPRSGYSHLQKIEAFTLQEHVYKELRESIMRGKFRPGETITIRMLADAFGTSPMPVREALQRLISEHALEPLGRRSTRIPPISQASLRDLFAVRGLVEGHAAALAAKLITDAELRELERVNAEIESAITSHDRARVIDRNRAFHFALYAAAKSPALLRAIEPLWLQCGPLVPYSYERLEKEGRTPGQQLVFHTELLKALRKRNARAARTALAHDIQTSVDALEEQLEFVNAGD